MKKWLDALLLAVLTLVSIPAHADLVPNSLNRVRQQTRQNGYAVSIPFGATFVGLGTSVMSQKGSSRSVDNPIAWTTFANNGYLTPRPGSDEGIGGNTTSQMLARVQYTAKQKPDVVFTDYSVFNDRQGGISVDTIKANILAIHAAIWAVNPNAVIVARGPFPMGSTVPDYTADKAAIVSFLQGLVKLSQPNALIFVPTPANWNVNTDIQSDNIHYNQSGGRKYAAATAAAIAPYLTLGGIYADLGASGYYGANLDTETALPGTSGTLSSSGSGTATGSVATGKAVTNACAANVVASKGTLNGQPSQVITISGTNSASCAVTFTEAAGSAIAASGGYGSSFEHFAQIRITAGDGASAPVGLTNMWEYLNASDGVNAPATHFNATRVGTDTLGEAVSGSVRSWSGQRRTAVSNVSPLIGFQLAPTAVDVRIEIAAPRVRQTELVAYAKPLYLGSDGVQTVTQTFYFGSAIANGNTVNIIPGAWAGGNLAYGPIRVYQGASTDTAIGSGTLLTTLTQGSLQWSASGLTSGQSVYLEEDVTNAFGTTTTRSLGAVVP